MLYFRCLLSQHDKWAEIFTFGCHFEGRENSKLA